MGSTQADDVVVGRVVQVGVVVGRVVQVAVKDILNMKSLHDSIPNTMITYTVNIKYYIKYSYNA